MTVLANAVRVLSVLCIKKVQPVCLLTILWHFFLVNNDKDCLDVVFSKGSCAELCWVVSSICPDAHLADEVRVWIFQHFRATNTIYSNSNALRLFCVLWNLVLLSNHMERGRLFWDREFWNFTQILSPRPQFCFGFQNVISSASTVTFSLFSANNSHPIWSCQFVSSH